MFNALRKFNPFVHQYDDTQRWCHEAITKHPFTPDLNRLLHKESWWVFVYDECQKGLPNHKLIEGTSRTYGEALTDDKFTLWKRPLGSSTFPIALEWNEKVKDIKLAHIKGKLVNIATPKLIELDSYKLNTVQFNRRRVNLNYFYREVSEVRDPSLYVASDLVLQQRHSQISVPHLQTIRAWMYVGVPDFWIKLATAGRQRIISGWETEKTLTHLKYQDGSLIKPTTRYKPNNLNNINEYYYFNATEFNGS